MPVLKDYRQVKTIALPGIDGGTVDIYTAPLVGDLIEIMPSGQEMSNAQSLEMLVRLIKSWNLTDEQGQTLPVTIENLKRLSVEDLVALSSVLEHVRAVVPDEKKKLVFRNALYGHGHSWRVVEYRLCEKFGWTLDQLYAQPADVVMDFIAIIALENDKQRREVNQLKHDAHLKRF